MRDFLKSFSFRFFLSFLILSFFCLFLGGYFFLKIIQNYFEEELNEKMTGIGKIIGSNLDLYLFPENENGFEESSYQKYLKEELMKYVSELNLKRLYLFNLKGELIVDTEGFPAGTALGNFLIYPNILTELKKGKNFTTLLYKIKNEYYKSAFVPVILKDGLYFGLGIEMPVEYLKNFRNLQFNIFIFFLLCLILSLIISYFLSKSISTPLKKLILETDNLVKSDFEKSINFRSKTELEKLGNALEILRQKIKSRDQYLKMMVSQIAHEIKNPLSIFKFYISFLSDKNLENEERVNYTNILMEETEKIEELLDSFINFVRKKEPKFEFFNLKDIFISLQRFYGKKAEEQKIEFKNEIPEDFKIYTDKDFLFHILFNLLKNSFEAMEIGGKIFISGDREGGYYRIFIKDQGVGIKDEIKEKIFDPFFTTKAKGVGLGLTIVEEYTKKLKGKLKFISKEREGTEFILYLPERREDGNLDN